MSPKPPPPPPPRAPETMGQDLHDSLAPTKRMRSPLQKKQLGRFELVERLGSGGQGSVYRAVDTHTGQQVALKQLDVADIAADNSLKYEFRRMEAIAHENLVTLYELGHDDGVSFFTMELVQGRDLKSAMQTGDLRDLLRQLVRGVYALHQAGKIHRDLKPENIIVTDQGRVVVLDFGLVEVMDRHTLDGETSFGGGTPPYMAPEQAACQLAVPASDWYAVGVILFEVLTDRWPFIHDPMSEKQCIDAPRLSTFLRSVDPDLDELVAGLLRRVPSERPGAAEILRWCAPNRSLTRVFLLPSPTELIERDEQLAAIYDSFDRVQRGQPACLDIVGAAGLGKTALVQQFTAQVKAAGAVVLTSACSQRESVPFRAFDRLLDAVAEHLFRLPLEVCEAIGANLGPKVDALVKLFPVFAGINWAPRSFAASPPDAREVRRQAFQGLKQLLYVIAAQQTTVIFLDNLQWGDVDSAHLMNHLLASPGVPPALFVMAYRRVDSPILREVGLQRTLSTQSYAMRTIELGPLSFKACLRLVRNKNELGRRIAQESGGNPALLRALVEEMESRGDAELPASGEGDLLRALVQARLNRVSAEAREVFAWLIITDQALPMSLLAHAGTGQGDIQALVAQLRRQGLARPEGEGDNQGLAPVSEPFQQAALQCLDPELICRSHGDLAAAYIVTNSGGPERIARHLWAAGRNDEAAEHASAAAFAATRAFAFDRAAELYRLALECKPNQWILAKNCAEALVQAGRGAEAAPLFLTAATHATVAAARRLQRAAAEQFFDHGVLARGSEILRPLLEDAGIQAPTSAQELAVPLSDESARLVRRGFTFKERSEFELSRRELDRIDLTWIAGKGLALNDPIRAGFFLVQCARLALDAGEPRRIARSLALCGLSHASRNHTIGEEMLDESLHVAERVGDHYAVGLAMICRGIMARNQGQWRAALTNIDLGIQYLREHYAGSAWEYGLGQASAMASLAAMGEFRAMSVRAESLYQRSQATGDVHSSILAALYSALTLLAAGKPRQARTRVLETEKQWPREGFHVQHLHALKIGVFCDLYEARPQDAWQRLSRAWPHLEASDFLRIAARRADALLLRARAALSLFRSSPADSGHLVEIISQDIAQLESENRPHLKADAHLLRAGMAACLNDPTALVRHLHLAKRGFDAVEMGLSSDVVERLLILYTGAVDPRGVARLDAHMHMQNITDISAWMRVMSPGLVD